MRKLKIFINSIGAEIQTVLLNLEDIVNIISDVRRRLLEIQTSYKAHQTEVLTKGGEGYGDIFLHSFKNMQDAIEALSDSVINLLAVAGVKLDEIRNKVLLAKRDFADLPSPQKFFVAIDNLVVKLDAMCIAIEGNIKNISMKIKSQRNYYLD